MSRIGLKTLVPDASAVTFDGVQVALPALRGPTSDEIVEQLHELQYRTALRVPRKLGEVVDEDDELNVDTLAYCQGALVPFSVREGLVIGPQHEQGLVGLRDALLGKVVGTTVNVPLTIPEGHPVPTLRGKPAVFTVRINGASQLFAETLESHNFLVEVKLGNTLESVMEKLAEQWLEARASQAREAAMKQALEQLATRANIQVGPEWVDQEIGRRWRAEEGALLARLKISMAEQEGALGAWLDNPEMRAESAQRLRASLVLRSVAIQEKLTDPEGLRETMNSLLGDIGVDAERVREGFQKTNDPALNAQTIDSLVYLRASELVWSKIKRA